jgi:hypothetical protein
MKQNDIHPKEWLEVLKTKLLVDKDKSLCLKCDKEFPNCLKLGFYCLNCYSDLE